MTTAHRPHLVSIPSVTHKGPHDTDARFFREAANNIVRGLPMGGSCVQAAVAELLRAAAAALEAGPLAGALRSVCGDCEEPIYRYQGGPWLHQLTGVQRCYRDPGTETAYPDPDYAIDERPVPAPWVIVRDEGAEAPLFYIVQCSVCPQRAALAAQPDPNGWVCPRCAEVTEPVRSVSVQIGTFTSGLVRSEVRVDGIAVEGLEFGPHDLVAHLDRSELGWWVDFCNCGEQFTAADADAAHRLHRQHREREESPAAADDDEYPLSEVRG